MSPPRVVIDTNALLSALLFHAGTLSWLRTAWQARRICPLVSRETMNELIRALGYPKFNLTDGEREDLLADYLPWCETIVISNPTEIPECRDRIRPTISRTGTHGPSRRLDDRGQRPARHGKRLSRSDYHRVRVP